MATAHPASEVTRCVTVFDAGALIALDRGDRDTWALLADIHRSGQLPVIPAPIVAQAWRGGARQARLAIVLSGAELVAADGPISLRAGELLGRARTADVLDALVALAAQDRPGHEVLTSDPGDIYHLLQVLNIQRTLRVV